MNVIASTEHCHMSSRSSDIIMLYYCKMVVWSCIWTTIIINTEVIDDVTKGILPNIKSKSSRTVCSGQLSLVSSMGQELSTCQYTILQFARIVAMSVQCVKNGWWISLKFRVVQARLILPVKLRPYHTDKETRQMFITPSKTQLTCVTTDKSVVS